MKSRTNWPLIGIVFFVIAGLYCFLGVILGVWLSATPHFPIERARLDVSIWGSGTLVCLIGIGASAFFLLRKPKGARRKPSGCEPEA